MTLRAHTTSSAPLATASVVVAPPFVSAIGLGLSVDGACMQRIQTIVEKPV